MEAFFEFVELASMNLARLREVNEEGNAKLAVWKIDTQKEVPFFLCCHEQKQQLKCVGIVEILHCTLPCRIMELTRILQSYG